MLRFRILLSLLAFAIILPQPLHAEFELPDAIEQFGEKRFYAKTPGRLHVGPVRIHPSIKTGFEYDSNILLEDRDGKDDVIFEVLPGVVLELPVNTHQLTIGYEADIEVFTSQRHSTQNDQNQNFFTLLDLNFPSWYINVLEGFRETSSRSGTTFTSRIPRFDQNINPKIGYRWKRFILETGFRHFVRDYRRSIDDTRDFQAVEWNTVLFYNLFARLKTLIDYQWAQLDYDDFYERNGTINQIRVGIDGELMPNLLVEARTGIQLRDYEVPAEPDFRSWVADFKMEYVPRENITLTLGLSRDAVEATFGDVNYYVRHSLEQGTEYRFHPRWAVFNSFKWSDHDYAERVTRNGRTGYRRDAHFQWNPGIRYIPNEWLRMQLDYKYLRRNSNFSDFDITDHRIALTSKLSY